MIKLFCDSCGKEMSDSPRSEAPIPLRPLIVKVNGVPIKVSLEWIETVERPNHFCAYCILDAIVSAVDKRPKAA